MKRKKSLTKMFLLCSIPMGSIAIKLLIWDSDHNRWFLEDLYHRPALATKLTLAPVIAPISTNPLALHPTTITDASRLHPTLVAAVFQPQSVAEIRQIVAEAQRTNRKISMSGARHTMGGQVAYPNSLHLDMLKFDKIAYNQAAKTITVQSGATWKQIQLELGKHDRAVRVMQDSNIFTVGGSLSSNVHGKDPRFGSLIESVVSFQILKADGQEMSCSRTENPELFRAVIGGMGLFGVITEVVLTTEQNSSYNYKVVHKPRSEMIAFMEEQISRPDLEMIEAQMAVDSANLLGEAQIYYFDKIPTNSQLSDDVTGDNSIWLRKLVYRTSRTGSWGKQWRWFMQKHVGTQLDPTKITRNSAMAAPFRTLQLNDPDTTDVLQEYFIPTAQVAGFLMEYEKMLRSHDLQLINVTVRKVKPDTNALVSYATTDMYAFVVYYKINKNDPGERQMTRFTQSMMDYLNRIEGKFYLAYRGYYTRSQIHQMYPQLTELFRLKQQYDPTELFSNKWYQAFR
jgi:decaprenylphospho-beta-D-ribofuranose 2-oxidase